MQKGPGRQNLSHFTAVLPLNPDQHLHISQSTHRQMVYAQGKRKSIWRGRKCCIQNDLIFTMTAQRGRDKTTWTIKKFKNRKEVKRICKGKKKKKKRQRLKLRGKSKNTAVLLLIHDLFKPLLSSGISALCSFRQVKTTPGLQL